uniref:C2H2-type domain-containing protein n=1 Tax=Plectus sambesii TaxID=2011161 RepID=A0A914VIF8_9BILA
MSICAHGIFTIYDCKPNSPIQCADCSAPFLDIHLLEEHICEFHLDCWVPYKCVLCQPQQHFMTELVLKMHMKYVHNTNKPIITYLSSEEKREKLHHLLVRSLIRSGTSYPATQSRWQADATSAAPLVELPKTRPRPTPSVEPTVHFAPSTSLIRPGVGASRQPTATKVKWQDDATTAPLVPFPQQRLQSRPISYIEEPMVHSAPSSNSAGTADAGYSSSYRDTQTSKAKMQPFTSNITTYMPPGFKTTTVDTTYRIGPRQSMKDPPDMVRSSRSRARTMSPPLTNYRNPYDRSLDEQVLVPNRSRDDDDAFQRANSVRNRRERPVRMGDQMVRNNQYDNRSLVGNIEFPQSWNEAPRMENSISMDNLRLQLKTDRDTMKNLCYRITVQEKRVERGETRRYDAGPSSTAV